MRSVLIFFFLFWKTVSAQVPNGSFENWMNGNPESWQTTNIPIVPASVLPDSDHYSGEVSAKGMVVQDFNLQPFQPYLGIYGGGAQGFSISNPYNLFNGWCKLSLYPGDHFTAYVRMFNSDLETIGEGFLAIDSSISSWTEFSIPVNYFNTDNPVTCTLFFTITDSSLLSSGHIGSYFLIDDLGLRVLVGIPSIVDEDILIHYYQDQDEISIDHFSSDKKLSYSIYDFTGKALVNSRVYSGGEKIFLGNYSHGIYLLDILMNEKRIVKKIFVE
jgi:hypothetical protein